MSNPTYTVSRQLHKSPSREWIGTFPSYILARATLERVFGVDPKDRLPWGTDLNDGFLHPEGRYFIVKENQPVSSDKNICSIPA